MQACTRNLGQDSSPTLPRVNVSRVVVGGAVDADWPPRIRQYAPGQLWLHMLLPTTSV